MKREEMITKVREAISYLPQSASSEEVAMILIQVAAAYSDHPKDVPLILNDASSLSLRLLLSATPTEGDAVH